MNLPKKYADILETNKLLKGIVYATIEEFGEILTKNKLDFFEEYTDHGIDHIESVLRSSLDLIPEDSLNQFIDSENVAALVLSIVLHDIGMHQTYHSFIHLIGQENILFPELDEFNWKDLWENYTEEAKKFNSQQKKDIFGDYDYIVSIPKLDNKDDLDGHQKKLIGEFIRRHHPRIAHEIAVHGFSTGFSIISFAERLDKDKLDIIGLIARSHGIEVRSTYQYLINRFYKLNKSPLNIHVYYLMIILRMSDYFQIDKTRLSLSSLKLKKFNSPVSKTEHDKHFFIREIGQVDEDPETLFVRAVPDNNFIYWKLQDLIKDIQLELDKSWAVLGEKYGKDATKPMLKYRRIISNLQEKSFVDSIQFVPEKIRFSTDEDMAKLLVSPLYGNNPTFGVRELIQNSVDAIHERIFQENLSNDFKGIIEITISHDSNEEYYFQIRDNGKGMDVKEIKNYFLKAGATNRKSKEWDELYVDKEMNTKVQKSGKFGVGILAAFLIGEELIVSTKRFNSKMGLSFTTNINSSDIEIRKSDIKEIGTTIKIKLKNEVFEYFKDPEKEMHLVPWDKWYTLDNPKIVLNCLLGFDAKFGYNEFDPSFFDKNDEWVEFSANGYSKLRWTYKKKALPYESEYQLSCNGLIIPAPPPLGLGSIHTPHVQVFDFNGILPINLSRNSLDASKLPFSNSLIKSIFKEILVKILKISPTAIISDNYLELSNKREIPALFGKLKLEDFYSGFAYTKQGYYIKNKYLNEIVRNFKNLKINIIDDDDDDLTKLSLRIDNSYVVQISRLHESSHGVYNYSTLYSDSSFIDWIILSEKENKVEWSKENTDYLVEYKTFGGKRFVLLRKSIFSKIPLYIGSMTDYEISRIHSIVCYSKLRYSLEKMNGEFDKFLADIFSNLRDCIIPYEERAKTEKIKMILEFANQ